MGQKSLEKHNFMAKGVVTNNIKSNHYKIKNTLKKSHIGETPTLSTDADSSCDVFFFSLMSPFHVIFF